MVYHLNLVNLAFYEEVGKAKTYLYAFMGIRLIGKRCEITRTLQAELAHLLSHLTADRIHNNLYSLFFITVHCTLHHLDHIGVEATAKA